MECWIWILDKNKSVRGNTKESVEHWALSTGQEREREKVFWINFVTLHRFSVLVFLVSLLFCQALLSRSAHFCPVCICICSSIMMNGLVWFGLVYRQSTVAVHPYNSIFYNSYWLDPHKLQHFHVHSHDTIVLCTPVHLHNEITSTFFLIFHFPCGFTWNKSKFCLPLIPFWKLFGILHKSWILTNKLLCTICYVAALHSPHSTFYTVPLYRTSLKTKPLWNLHKVWVLNFEFWVCSFKVADLPRLEFKWMQNGGWK